MGLLSWFVLYRTPKLWTQLSLMNDSKGYLRLHYLYSAIESGLLDALVVPTSKEALVEKLQVQRPELLETMLNLGISIGELSVKKGLYRITGKRSKTLSSSENDPLVAIVQEYITYYGSVYRNLAARLTGAPLGHYLEETGPLIARSSRVTEPYVADFVRTLVKTNKPMRILEVGCGSGIHLLHAANSNPQTYGIAIDMDQKVVGQAKANLSQWGIDRIFKVMVADIRYPIEGLDGPFDLITLYNNLYYFPFDERKPLFQRLRSMLTFNGEIVIVSLMQGKSLISLNFDLVLRSTEGCAPLPELEETVEQLKESGLSEIKKVKLIPRSSFYGLLATLKH